VSTDSTHDSPAWEEIFGHPEPYKHQRKAISEALDVVTENGFYAMEAGCGTGKTMTSLTVAGESIRDNSTGHTTAFCLTSVLQQLRQFVQDARQINRNLPDDVAPLNTLVLLGKSNICPYTLAGENDFDEANTNSKCNTLRRNTSKAGRNESFHSVKRSALLEAEQQTLDGSSQNMTVEGAEAPYTADLPVEYGRETCPFYAAARDTENHVPFDFSDAEANVIDEKELVRLSVEHGVCPHTAMSRLMDDADVVVGNYYHAFDYNTRQLTQSIIEPSTLLICDESHMLEPRVRDVLSQEASLYDLEQAARELLKVAVATGHGTEHSDIYVGDRPDDNLVHSELAKYGVAPSELVPVVELLQWVADTVEAHAESFLDREFPNWEARGDNMPSRLEAPLREPDVAEQDDLTAELADTGLAEVFQQPLGQMVTAVTNVLNKSDVDDLPGELALPEVVRLLTQWRKRDHEQHFREVTLDRRWEHRNEGLRKHWRVSLELRNCLPGGLIASQLADFGGGILMSATLKPFNVYKDVVGLDYLDHQHDRPVETAELVKKFPEENQASFIVDAPKFTSRKRGPTDEWNDVRKQYARTILSVARTPGNILVCMPSYAEAEWAGEILRETNQFEKGVLIDESSSNDETEELKEEFFKGDGKILVTSIRGTLTEGVDYRGDRLHGVVVVGVPIPNTGSPRVRALQHAYELEYGSLGFPYSMFVPAVRKARQALGRVIRGEDDVGVRVLVDERYASSGQGAVRQYLSDHEQQRYDVTDPASLQGKIEAFWQNQNAF